jgi:hypothetical protein
MNNLAIIKRSALLFNQIERELAAQRTPEYIELKNRFLLVRQRCLRDMISPSNMPTQTISKKEANILNEAFGPEMLKGGYYLGLPLRLDQTP